MNWTTETLENLNQIGGSEQGSVKKLFASAVEKHHRAAELAAQATELREEANEKARLAFAYIEDEEVNSVVNSAGDRLTRKANTARANLDKKQLKRLLLDHLDVDLVDRLYKKATKKGKAPEHAVGIVFKAGNGNG